MTSHETEPKSGFPRFFDCPYLNRKVELTQERYAHIVSRHQEFLDYENTLLETVGQPDVVIVSIRDAQSRLFHRWFEDVERGKFAVVVIKCDDVPVRRHWILTWHLSDRLKPGQVEWRRN